MRTSLYINVLIVILSIYFYEVGAFKWTQIQNLTGSDPAYLISRSRFSLLPYSNSKNAGNINAPNYISFFGFDSSLPLSEQYFFTFLSLQVLYEEDTHKNVFGILAGIGDGYNPYISSVIYPPDTTGMVAVLVKPLEYHLIGGMNMNTTQYVNDITQLQIILDVEKGNLTLAKSPNPYRGFQRMGHTVVYNSNGTFLIYGGYNQSGIYGGLFQYQPTKPDIIPINPPTSPPNRAWHSCLLTESGVMWLFGGYDGTNYYNDIWKYNGIWTKFSPIGDAPSPRAGHVMLFPKLDFSRNDESVFCIYGGETTGNLKLNDIWIYNISSNTWFLVDSTPTAPKRAYHSGQAIYSTLTKTTTMFFVGGIDDTGIVSSQIVAFDLCRTVYQYHCWNGVCEDTSPECSYLIPCNGTRCGDGTCSTIENDPDCTTGLTCTPPLQLCGDGSGCSKECTVTYGCLPDSKPIQCPDGTCVDSSTQCNPLNCPSDLLSCYNGCGKNCSEPDFLYPILEMFPSTVILYQNSSTIYVVSLSGGYQAIVTIDGSTLINPVPVTTSLSSLTSTELFSIGPHPTWTSEFQSIFIASTVGHLQISNITKIIQMGGKVTILIHFIQPSFDQYKYCIAQAIPWYWDPSDTLDSSPLNNVSYIAEYRNLVKPYIKPDGTVNNTIPGIDAINHPSLRWSCLVDTNNRWPQVDSSDPTKLNWYGIYLIDSINAPIAIISAIRPVPPELSLPKDPTANFIVLGIAACILFVLLVIVGYKALQKK